MALAIAFEQRSQEIKRQFWTRRQYRLLKLNVILTNPGDADYSYVSCEVLTPESALFDLSGDDWAPTYLRSVDDIVYDVWDDSPSIDGFGLPHNGTMSFTMGLHLHPYITELTLLGRVFIAADPVADYTRATFQFPAFVPAL